MNREQRQELWAQHKALAEAAHERDDIPEANYQYGWVAALTAEQTMCFECGGTDCALVGETYAFCDETCRSSFMASLLS